MQRGESGGYETTSAGGETVRAFVPAPLPPTPRSLSSASLRRPRHGSGGGSAEKATALP